MPLLTDYNNSQITDFKYRVRMALISTAINVQSESAATAAHAARSAGALAVLANPAGYADLMAPAFTVDGTADPATVTDAQLETRASSIWNAYFVQG